jgi:hypothetical protein
MGSLHVCVFGRRMMSKWCCAKVCGTIIVERPNLWHHGTLVNWVPMAVAVVLSTIFVMLGLVRLPYGFFMLLRIVLCITAAIGVKRAREAQKNNWVWVYGILAVLYNPILPVHLGDKGVWVVVNIATVVIFWVGLFKFENVVPYLRSLALASQPTIHELRKVAVKTIKVSVSVCAICASVYGLGYLVLANGLDKPVSHFFTVHPMVGWALVVALFPVVNEWLKKHT